MGEVGREPVPESDSFFCIADGADEGNGKCCDGRQRWQKYPKSPYQFGGPRNNGSILGDGRQRCNGLDNTIGYILEGRDEIRFLLKDINVHRIQGMRHDVGSELEGGPCHQAVGVKLERRLGSSIPTMTALTSRWNASRNASACCATYAKLPRGMTSSSTPSMFSPSSVNLWRASSKSSLVSPEKALRTGFPEIPVSTCCFSGLTVSPKPPPQLLKALTKP